MYFSHLRQLVIAAAHMLHHSWYALRMHFILFGIILTVLLQILFPFDEQEAILRYPIKYQRNLFAFMPSVLEFWCCGAAEQISVCEMIANAPHSYTAPAKDSRVVNYFSIRFLFFSLHFSLSFWVSLTFGAKVLVMQVQMHRRWREIGVSHENIALAVECRCFLYRTTSTQTQTLHQMPIQTGTRYLFSFCNGATEL